MSVSPVGSPPVAAKTPERAEAGAERDHDGDDKAAAATATTAPAAPVKAATAPGIGQIIDKTA